MVVVMEMFYRYKQQPSGGEYIAPAQNLVVEADSWEEANKLAESHGVYFDGLNCYGWCMDELGYNDGRVCSCQIDYGEARWQEIFDDALATAGEPNLDGVDRNGIPYAKIIHKYVEALPPVRWPRSTRRAI